MIIRWSPRSQEDLIKQTAWLEENRGHQIVNKYFVQIHAAIERLRRGEIVLYRLYDAARNIRYCAVNENTSLYYRVIEEDGEIELMTFFNTRQDPNKLKL